VDTHENTLFIDIDCRECEGTITAEVPVNVAVDADVGSGSIKVYDIEADVTAETGSGHITIDGTTGNVNAETGSGGITGRDLSADLIDASAGSGSVTVQGR
jgi:DUF4097 and DUF4098 domain-containing protein YvlB